MSPLLPPSYLFALAAVHLGFPWLLFCLFERRKGPWFALLLQAGATAAFISGALDVYELIPGMWWGEDVLLELQASTLFLCGVLLVSIVARADTVRTLRKVPRIKESA